ncbi:MAG: peroxiredoxin [Alphaproteobacteria bacterium]|nr:peroxiredoxin [Alphaproteobacteria bacterium]
MTITQGDKVPAVTLKEMTGSGPQSVETADLFGGKKVVAFCVPGAFTPTCSAKHLPGFVQKADAIRAKGVDDVVCLAINDPFVVGAWGDQQGAAGKIRMLADGSGDLAKAMGVELDLSALGLGMRARRYSMIVEDGTVTRLNLEDGVGFEVSSAEKILEQL